MGIIEKIHNQVSGKNHKVLLPEAEIDDRVLRAAQIMASKKLIKPILVGDESEILKKCDELGIEFTDEIEIVDGNDPGHRDDKISFFKEKLAHKNPTEQQLLSLSKNTLFTAGWLLANGKGDAAVAGSIASTSDVIRAALRTVGVAENSTLVSSTFLMEMPNGRALTYADCAVVPYPDAEQLASIAIDSGLTHKKLTAEEPVIAFLSFSTKGSAAHEKVDLVREAFEIAQAKKPQWLMDGELQFDTAYLPEVAERKAPNSQAAGKANVFIFPNLDAGNIAYKITERLAGATATGPVLQGLTKPYLDLSRGCSSQDIVNTACVGVLLGT